MEIKMSCTIGVPRTSQWRGFTGGIDHELSRVGGARASGGQKSPCKLDLWGKANKLKQNVKIEYKFLRFHDQIF